MMGGGPDVGEYRSEPELGSADFQVLFSQVYLSCT